MPKSTMPLGAYLTSMQNKAMHLEHLLGVANFLTSEGACSDERDSLFGLAEVLAAELNLGLDSISLPEGSI